MEFEENESEDDGREVILQAKHRLGRPGVRLVLQQLRRAGHQCSEAQVAAVLRQQTA